MPRKPSDRPRYRRYDPLSVLAYIASYRQTHRQRSPSERQIQIALGISAPSVVHMIVRRLQRAELLTSVGEGRGYGVDLTLTEAGQTVAQRWQEEHPPSGSE